MRAAAVMSLIAVGGCGDDADDTGHTDTTDADEVVTGSVSEWAVDVDRDEVPAGAVTFTITNDGTVEHEFLVVRTDVPDGSIPVEESGFSEEDESLVVVNEIPEFAVGTTESLTLDLDAGAYQLVCNLPGHYESGMHTSFMVS